MRLFLQNNHESTSLEHSNCKYNGKVLSLAGKEEGKKRSLRRLVVKFVGRDPEIVQEN